MDYLNRLKSAVTTVLPVGNPITNEYEILNQKASGGPGMLWKIFDGIQRNTKQEVSIFVFEKKHLERFNKRDRDAILDALKNGVSRLTRLRHPKILSILHPLEDSRESLAFATEPVFCCLANVLGQHDNIPPAALAVFKDFTLYDVEIKYGLLQVVEGLAFLHNSVHMVHTNICPESIFINSFGCWKIAGFEFCTPNANTQSQAPYYPAKEWDSSLSPIAQPKLNYLAPEYALTSSCDPASDMFSVGVLINAIYAGGKPLFDSMNDWSTFKKNISELKMLKLTSLGAVPNEAREHIKMLLNVEPSVRPDADQLSKVQYFEDVGVVTLQYLDLLVQKDNLQKSQFFKGLTKILDKLPARVNVQRVFPSLMQECVNNNMIPFVLPNMMVVAEQISDSEFMKIVFPAFIPLFKVTEPVQVALVFLQNMNLLLSKTPPNEIRNHVLPMVARALEADQHQIQELCLHIIPTFAGLVEYTSLKNSIIPRIRKLCLSATTLSVRVNCLVCLGKILEHLDRWYVLDEVLPMLQEIPSREPAVLMSILGIYKIALTHKKLGITKEMLANKIVPFLFPLCIDNGLNLMQFNAFIAIVKDMIGRVESEQRLKLEQLNTVQMEQRKLQQFAQETIQGGATATSNGDASFSHNDMDDFMSGLGFGSFTAPSVGKGGGAGGGASSKTSVSGSSSSLASGDDTSSRTGLPAQSLTLEEKAKLARDQELQQRLKSQSPLQAQQTSTVSSSSVNSSSSKPSTRDLTSTLSASPMFPTAVNSAPTGFMSAGFPNTGAGNATSGVAWGTNNMSANSSFGLQPQQQQLPLQPATKAADVSKKNVDLSAFDNLMSLGPKPSPSLGSMSGGSMPPRAPGPNPFGASAAPPQLRAPNAANNAMNSNFMPSNSVGNFGMGAPTLSGGFGMTGGGGGGFPTATGGFQMSAPLMRPPASANFQPAQPTGTRQPLSNKDIADFLG